MRTDIRTGLLLPKRTGLQGSQVCRPEARTMRTTMTMKMVLMMVMSNSVIYIVL